MESLTYRYTDNAGDKRSIQVIAADWGWKVIYKKNGQEVARVTETGSLMTVMQRAMSEEF